MATLTVEMNMLVIVYLVIIVTTAEFVAYAVATILKDMDKMMLSKESQCTEDTRFVNRKDFVFQLR